MILPFLDTIPENEREAFAAKVGELATLLNTEAAFLMFVMFFESRLNPAAVNPYTRATGLIQFMPSTAASLGTTVEALQTMTRVEQIPYVYAYLKPYRGRLKRLQDVYLAVFFPAAIGRADEWIVQTKTLSASTIARQNPVFDLNKDNQITVGEIKRALLAKLPAGLVDYFLSIEKKS